MFCFFLNFESFYCAVDIVALHDFQGNPQQDRGTYFFQQQTPRTFLELQTNIKAAVCCKLSRPSQLRQAQGNVRGLEDGVEGQIYHSGDRHFRRC